MSTQDGAIVTSRPEYEQEVFAWGSAKPWGNVRLTPAPAFGPEAIKTDGIGNVLEMPHLVNRPCFGRIETYLRHGDEKETKVIDRTTGETRQNLTRCGRCKVRDACGLLVGERIRAKPTIRAAIIAWRDDTMQRHGKRVYTGEPSGRLWEAVKRAIVEAGRFASCNDEAVAAHAATEAERLREKWRKDKRRQRAKNIAAGCIDQDMLREAPAERDRRVETLFAACRSPAASRSMRAWTRETCEMVADTWLARTILQARCERYGATAIANWLIAQGLHRGKDFGALRVGSVR